MITFEEWFDRQGLTVQILGQNQPGLHRCLSSDEVRRDNSSQLRMLGEVTAHDIPQLPSGQFTCVEVVLGHEIEDVVHTFNMPRTDQLPCRDGQDVPEVEFSLTDALLAHDIDIQPPTRREDIPPVFHAEYLLSV